MTLVAHPPRMSAAIGPAPQGPSRAPNSPRVDSPGQRIAEPRSARRPGGIAGGSRIAPRPPPPRCSPPSSSPLRCCVVVPTAGAFWWIGVACGLGGLLAATSGRNFRSVCRRERWLQRWARWFARSPGSPRIRASQRTMAQGGRALVSPTGLAGPSVMPMHNACGRDNPPLRGQRGGSRVMRELGWLSDRRFP